MPPVAATNWSVRRRAIVSAFVALHVTAVFVAPFAWPPSSALGERARAVLRPYIEATELNHGYRFFNIPGPSHLVRYRVDFADGRRPIDGILPHRQEHWPRLRYHRHFMLTESLESSYQVLPQPPEGAAPGSALYEEWKRAREELNRMADIYTRSYAEHLLARHGGSKVTLWGQERGLPSIAEVQSGVKLGDPRYLRETKLGEWEARK
ncbi:MAG: hypothetical protein DCC68_21840 [Planctomycetota bacterium]|nr:MAG: hypothetical protein DCC68_21840 [Planctomycetota bacterium]